MKARAKTGARVCDPHAEPQSKFDFRLVRCRSDNYAVLFHDAESGETALVDAPEFGPIDVALQETGWNLTHILITHHHADHVAANEELKAKHGATIIGPEKNRGQIPGMDRGVRDGDKIDFGGEVIDVLAVPGHTLGHVAYYMCASKVVFTGDTLFSLGCGKIFEGDGELMWHSLDMLRHLPEQTMMYCGHEYTLNNAEFALTVEPGNVDLQKRAEEVRRLVREGRPTIPVSIGLEKKTNPFLRPDSYEIRENLNMHGVENWRVFAALRERKDQFG